MGIRIPKAIPQILEEFCGLSMKSVNFFKIPWIFVEFLVIFKEFREIPLDSC
jgi:hypothetical protein